METGRYVYAVEMRDGRSLKLSSDGSLALALGNAGERLQDVRSWFVSGPGVGLRYNLAATEHSVPHA